jgi:hypothetical protein
MTVSIAGRSVARCVAVAGLGAAFAVLATVLTWASYTMGADMGGPRTEAVTGLDYGNGRIVLGLGIVVLGLIVAFLKEIRVEGLWGVVAVFGGLILLVMLLSYFTGLFYPKTMPVLAITDKGDLASSLGEFNNVLKSARASNLDTSGSSAGLGIGFFIEILAGVAIVAGGILGILDPRRAAQRA